MIGRGERRAFGELEQRVLASLWAVDAPLSVGQVLESLHGDVAYTTVAKVLDRLVAKRTVARSPVGRGFVYRPINDEASFAASQIRMLLERAGDRDAVLHGFAEGLAPGEAEELVALLEAARERRKPA